MLHSAFLHFDMKSRYQPADQSFVWPAWNTEAVRQLCGREQSLELPNGPQEKEIIWSRSNSFHHQSYFSNVASQLGESTERDMRKRARKGESGEEKRTEMVRELRKRVRDMRERGRERVREEKKKSRE